MIALSSCFYCRWNSARHYMIPNIFSYNCSCSDFCSLADCDARKDCCRSSNRSSLFNSCGFPQIFIGRRVFIICKCSPWADKDIVFYDHACRNKTKCLYLYIIAYDHSFAYPNMGMDNAIKTSNFSPNSL